MFKEIKYAYQRVRYGFDERIYWDFSSYFEQIVPPLKIFCEKRLANKESMRLNPKRFEVYTETLRLIKRYEDAYEEYNLYGEMTVLFEYVGKHLDIYWD